MYNLCNQMNRSYSFYKGMIYRAFNVPYLKANDNNKVITGLRILAAVENVADVRTRPGK